MPGKGKAVGKRSDVIFLECDLDKALKENLVDWVASERDYFGMIEKCVDGGIKVSFGFDSYNECFMCSLSRPMTVEKTTITYVLVGRGGDLMQSLQAAMFKHYIMLEESWDDLGRKNARKETDWA